MKRYTKIHNEVYPYYHYYKFCLRFYATGNFQVKKHFYFMNNNNNNNNNNIDANNLKRNLYSYLFNR